MPRKARPIAPGDPIALVAPGSAPLRPEHLHEGIEQLRRRGYRVEPGQETYRANGYLSATDAERLRELNAAFRRRDVPIIMAVRGGYGSLRLIPDVDFAAMADVPKLLVGYSDITALHLALYLKTGLPGVLGGMAAVDWRDPEPETEAHFWRVLAGEHPLELISPRDAPVSIRSGVAEGVLLGGNLTLLVRLIGTPWLPPLDGAILCFEEVGEPPYRIDGLLAHLKLSGWLDRLGGVVIGQITESEPLPGRPSLTLDEVFDAYFARAPYPVVRGLRFGHIPKKVTVPVGVMARLEVGSGSAQLTVLEPVVA